jgi:SPP1 gp7 family putative phage head morphogenesis protein
MSLNQDLYDRVVQHLADVRLYEMEGHVLNERAIRRHKDRLEKLLKADIAADVSTEVSRATLELYTTTKNHLQDLSDASEQFHTNNLGKSASSFFSIQRPTRGVDVAREMLGPNIGLSGDLRSHFNDIGTGELRRLDKLIKDGMSRGDSQKKIIADAVKSVDITKNQVSALVRTSMTNIENSALERVLQANIDIIAGYRFTAVLDSRTSRVCSYHDGKVYKVGDNKYRPPLHWNCRSSMVPVLKSKQAIAELQSARVKQDGLGKLPPGQLDGAPPPVENYSGWLKRQALDVQIDHLGSEDLARLFNNGKLAVKDFFNAVGDSISITRLRRLDTKRTSFLPVFQVEEKAASSGLLVPVSRPHELMRDVDAQKALAEMYIADEMNMSQAMSLTDFRGTTLPGKRSVRVRSNNEFDERNNIIDPFTGEMRSNLTYDPDFSVLQERLDFMRNSKVLRSEQKAFIEEFVDGLEDKISVNNQSVVVENLRVLFERYMNKKEPWENFAALARKEAQYSVTNVSRILDRRSRARDEIFSTYGTGDTPKVQILGKYFTFDDLADNMLENQRFVQDWSEKVGRGVAQELYWRGRSPLKSYFSDPVKDKPWWISAKSVKKQLVKGVKGKVKEFPGGSKLLQLLAGEPSERMIDSFIRSVGEQYRQIVDMEVDLFKMRRGLVDMAATSVAHNDAAVRVLAKCVKSVASGMATDYDSIAISVGKTLYEQWQPFNPWYKPTMADYHKQGSEILEGLRRQGRIRVMSRGKTRRAVIDLDTGRASGPWKQTVSREVTILDPEMLELQSRARRVVIAQRFGNTNPRDKLRVLPNAKSYVDSRGRDTGIPIVTRRANTHYDKILVDRDFADMLNHTMSVQYEVDPEFAGFMDEVVRFRDPRGNSKKYDELNHFRQLILQRGDQGFGFMQTVRWHKQRGKPFTVTAQIDGRGRVYYQGYLTPTGGEVARPFLNSTVKRQFGLSQMRELSLQLGALIGPATEALTQSGRVGIFSRNEREILSLGRLLMAKTQRDQKIRDFLEHPLIKALEGEEVPKLTRLSLEYARAYEHTGGRITDPEAYNGMLTQLMIENDASASGAQIISLSTRDRALAVNSNVLATTQKNRLYDLVAMDTADDPEFQALPAIRDAGITWLDLQKAAKAQNMVSFYGAGKATQAANIEAKFASVLKKKGYTVITKDDLKAITSIIDKEVKNADYVGAVETARSLKALKAEIVDVVDGEASVSSQLMKEAEEMHPDVADFVQKLNNVRVGIVGPNDFKQVSEIMSRHLARRAPVTQKFVQFWNQAAKAYVEDTNAVDIPWVTFDGKTLYQRYRPKVQTLIEFYDPVAKRMVRNIYEDKAKDGKLLGKASIARARIGTGVNGNHMNDASIVRQFHLWGKRAGVGTGTIHDAFFTNIGDVDLAKDALREIYANAAESDTIRNTLRAMRDKGMSEESYQRLLQQAKEDGLIDPPNPITRADVLAKIPMGHDWYGIGP